MNKQFFGVFFSLAVMSFFSASALAEGFQPPLPDWQAGINRQLTARIDARMEQEMMAKVETDYQNLYADASEQDDFDMNGLHVAWEVRR